MSKVAQQCRPRPRSEGKKRNEANFADDKTKNELEEIVVRHPRARSSSGGAVVLMSGATGAWMVKAFQERSSSRGTCLISPHEILPLLQEKFERGQEAGSRVLTQAPEYQQEISDNTGDNNTNCSEQRLAFDGLVLSRQFERKRRSF